MKKGFDLNQLAWSPATDDEREDVRRREPWFTFWPQLDDEAAEALLRKILAIRHQRLRSSDAGEKEEQEALNLAAQLIEGVAGWAATRHMQLSYIAAHFLRDTLDPNLNRMLATGNLKLPVTLIPAAARKQLAEGLDKLREGVVQPILAHRVGGPRGIEWIRRQEIELDLLGWIEWQVARKQRRIGQALKTVAEACGLETAQAVRNWKRRLVERLETHEDEKGYVDRILEPSRTIGRMEATGKDPFNDPVLAARAAALRVLDLQQIGNEYRRASHSRADLAPRRRTRRTAT